MNYNYECYVQKQVHSMCKSCAQHKKIVVGLSYPMPLCYSVKAALSYIAAGSCDSVVYIYNTITPHNSPECHAAPSQQTASSRGVE